MFKTLSLATAVAAVEYPWKANGDDYLALSAEEKSFRLMENCNTSHEEGNWQNAPGVLTESMAPTFTTPGDEMPCDASGCRTKDIHSVGTIASVKLVSNGDHPFTGIFKGADYGIVRHSTATAYNPAVKLLKPGLGLKFLRDGVDSANLVSMYSVDG